jgi:hypothetical protein
MKLVLSSVLCLCPQPDTSIHHNHMPCALQVVVDFFNRRLDDAAALAALGRGSGGDAAVASSMYPGSSSTSTPAAASFRAPVPGRMLCCLVAPGLRMDPHLTGGIPCQVHHA